MRRGQVDPRDRPRTDRLASWVSHSIYRWGCSCCMSRGTHELVSRLRRRKAKQGIIIMQKEDE